MRGCSDRQRSRKQPPRQPPGTSNNPSPGRRLDHGMDAPPTVALPSRKKVTPLLGAVTSKSLAACRQGQERACIAFERQDHQKWTSRLQFRRAMCAAFAWRTLQLQATEMSFRPCTVPAPATAALGVFGPILFAVTPALTWLQEGQGVSDCIFSNQ